MSGRYEWVKVTRRPIVSGGSIYQHGRLGGDEVLQCISLESGKPKWKKGYPQPFKIGGGGERHGAGPKSNPTLADDRVFTFSIAGVLTAWDAKSGDQLWRRDFGSRFKSAHPYWGHSTSPIVDEDRVIVHFGTDEEGTLMALDVKSGDEQWSLGNDGASYSSPLLVEIGGVRQIIEWNHRALVGVDSQKGTKLWEVSFPHEGHNQNMPTPVYHDGVVLLGAENRGLHGFEPKLVDGKWSVEEIWHQRKISLDMSSAVINDGFLYGMSHYQSGRLFCVDPASGEIKWLGPPRLGQNVAFLSVPGYVIAQTNSGEIQVFRANSEKYDKVVSYEVSDSETWAAPVLLEDGMLIKDHDTLSRYRFSNP